MAQPMRRAPSQRSSGEQRRPYADAPRRARRRVRRSAAEFVDAPEPAGVVDEPRRSQSERRRPLREPRQPPTNVRRTPSDLRRPRREAQQVDLVPPGGTVGMHRRSRSLNDAERAAAEASKPDTVSAQDAPKNRISIAGLAAFMRRGDKTTTLPPEPAERDTERLHAAQAKNERLRAAQAKSDERLRAAQAKSDERLRAAQAKSEGRLRAVRARLEEKARLSELKREEKARLAEIRRETRQAAETKRQLRADERVRARATRADARRAAAQERKARETETIIAARRDERDRELNEVERRRQRLLSITPYRARPGAQVVLTPLQRHHLLKILVMMQMQEEFLALGHPGILSQYGYPFARDAADLRPRHRLPWHARSGAPTVWAYDVASEPLILRHMFQVHLRHLPGLRTAPLSFWRQRIQAVSEDYCARAMSTALERDELVLSHLLTLAGTQYLGLFFARGVGVRGDGELRGPGVGEPGTEAWGAGKAWGAGTVKRGLESPYELTDDDVVLINELYEGPEQAAWLAAGERSERMQQDWAAFKEHIIEQETGFEDILSYLTVSHVGNLPEELRNVEEWVQIHVAVVLRWLLVDSPAAEGLFNFVRVAHVLFPYWPVRQTLRMANAHSMIQILIKLLLVQPGGVDSIYQRIVSYSIGREASTIQTTLIEPLRAEITEPALAQKVEAYVRTRTPARVEAAEAEARRTGDDILTVLLLSDDVPLQLDAALQEHVLVMQAAYAASPYRRRLELAYPATTPRGAVAAAPPAWGVAPVEAEHARQFALLKLLLRELLNKRDHEQLAQLLGSNLVVNLLREGLQHTFFSAISAISRVADLSARLGDFQRLLDDLIEVRRTTDNALEHWVALAARHHAFLYFFLHEIAPVMGPVWEWCQTALDFLSLSTTDPLHPADRSADDIEVNLDEMLQDARLSDADVDDIVDELDALAVWSRWSKIRRELVYRRVFLARIEGPNAPPCDVDALFERLLRAEGAALDDGSCDEVRGTERRIVPWAVFDVADPLGQALAAEPDAAEWAMPPHGAAVPRPPSLRATRKLMPLFRELLVAQLPDWYDAQVNGEPRLRPHQLLRVSDKLLLKGAPRGLRRLRGVLT